MGGVGGGMTSSQVSLTYIYLFHRHGYIESKIRLLVGNLERNPFIRLAHVTPESFGPLSERYVLLIDTSLICIKLTIFWVYRNELPVYVIKENDLLGANLCNRVFVIK